MASPLILTLENTNLVNCAVVAAVNLLNSTPTVFNFIIADGNPEDPQNAALTNVQKELIDILVGFKTQVFRLRMLVFPKMQLGEELDAAEALQRILENLDPYTQALFHFSFDEVTACGCGIRQTKKNEGATKLELSQLALFQSHNPKITINDLLGQWGFFGSGNCGTCHDPIYYDRTLTQTGAFVIIELPADEEQRRIHIHRSSDDKQKIAAKMFRLIAAIEFDMGHYRTWVRLDPVRPEGRWLVVDGLRNWYERDISDNLSIFRVLLFQTL